MLFGGLSSLVDKLQKQLSTKLKTTDLGNMTIYLEINITRDLNGKILYIN